MPNIKKISKTVEITHAVIQGQVPNVEKTDEIPQAQFMPRGTTTVVQKQCPTLRRSRLGCSSKVQYENEVVDMPVVKGRCADSDTQEAATWLQATEVADSTALRSSARRTERAGARREPCMLNDHSSASQEGRAQSGLLDTIVSVTKH